MGFILAFPASSAARGGHVAQASPVPLWLEHGSLSIECPKAAETKVQVSASSVGVGSMSSGLGASWC